MKIDIDYNDTCFREVNEGQIFILQEACSHNTAHLKIRPVVKDCSTDKSTYNAIKLNDGTLCCFSNVAKVHIPREAVLKIK